MQREKKVLFIENDGLTRRRIISRFVAELSASKEIIERKITVSKIGSSKLDAGTAEPDLILLEPSIMGSRAKVEEMFPAWVIVEVMDFHAYGLGESELVSDQIIELLENGRRPRRGKGKKQSLMEKLTSVIPGLTPAPVPVRVDRRHD